MAFFPALLSTRVLAQSNPNGDSGAAETSSLPLAALVYCGECHQPPRPGAVTTEAWKEVLPEMSQHMQARMIHPPAGTMEFLTQYYLSNSPARFPPTPDDLEPPWLEFEKQSVGNPPRRPRPEITHVNITDLDQDGKQDVLFCDNGFGTVSWLRFEDGKWIETELGKAPGPVHTAVFDFEGDGDLDIVVAAMGSIHPDDRLIGEVHLLLNHGDQTFEDSLLLKGIARISDVEPGDYDGDGDIDFALAMYGWRTTGGLAWVEQVSPGVFRFHDILVINGVMRVQAVDLDGKGPPEIAALITQEHETISVFTYQGNGVFTNQVIARANHPAFGSSSFNWVDLDQDGDSDVLYTNGDMMDIYSEVKPYHGVRWLENQDGKFQLRPLASMPGCYCARAHDMDGDGDLDVVVSNLNFWWQYADFPSLIWLENDGKQVFTRRRIAYSPANLPSCDVGDLNHDGIPDIIAGGFHFPGPLARIGRLTAWLGKRGKEEVETKIQNK